MNLNVRILEQRSCTATCPAPAAAMGPSARSQSLDAAAAAPAATLPAAATTYSAAAADAATACGSAARRQSLAGGRYFQEFCNEYLEA